MTTPNETPTPIPAVTHRSKVAPDGGTEATDVCHVPIDVGRAEPPPPSVLARALASQGGKIAAWVSGITATLAGVAGLVTVMTPVVQSWFAFRSSDNAEATRLENIELRLQRCDEQVAALRLQSEQRFRFLEGATCELGITYMNGFCALDFYATPKDPSLPRTARGVEIAPWHALPPAQLKPLPSKDE